MSIRQWQKLKQAFFKDKEKKEGCRKFSEGLSTLKDQRSAFAKFKTEVLSGGVNLPKVKVLREQVKELKLRVSELADEYCFVFKGKSAEGKDIVIDLRQERRESEEFIREHKLVSLADALPKKFRLTPETRKRVKEAICLGFDRVMFMPGADEQEKVPITTFKKELADTPLDGLSDEDQYSESYLEDPLSTECTMVEHEKTPRRGAYLLFYSSGSVPQETKNLTFGKAEELFKRKGWNGLTLQEFYLLERRKECRKNNHGWAKYENDDTKSNWGWCLASRAPGGCVDAGWNAADRRVFVRWDRSDDSRENLGARPVVVVSLG